MKSLRSFLMWSLLTCLTRSSCDSHCIWHSFQWHVISCSWSTSAWFSSPSLSEPSCCRWKEHWEYFFWWTLISFLVWVNSRPFVSVLRQWLFWFSQLVTIIRQYKGWLDHWYLLVTDCKRRTYTCLSCEPCLIQSTFQFTVNLNILILRSFFAECKFKTIDEFIEFILHLLWEINLIPGFKCALLSVTKFWIAQNNVLECT